jgi:hypothetical protein
VVARRAGNKWYLAGINGEKIEKQLSLDLSFLKNKTGQIISSGKNDDGYNSFDNKAIKIPEDGNLKLDLKGNDGFVIVFE